MKKITCNSKLPKANGRPQLWLRERKDLDLTRLLIIYPNGKVMYNDHMYNDHSFWIHCDSSWDEGCTSDKTQDLAIERVAEYERGWFSTYFLGYL